MQVQSDEFGAISYTFYFMFQTFVRYLCHNKWWCMETRKVEQSDGSTKWDASAKVPARNYFGVPLQTDSGKLVGICNKFGIVLIKKSLLGEIPLKPIDRIVQEFSNNGAVPTED